MSTFTPGIAPAAASSKLRGLLADDPTVYVVQRHTSASGMTRRLSLFIVDTTAGEYSDKLRDITVTAAAVLGYRVRSEDHTISVQGVGMDMHYHVVSSLSRRLYEDDETPRPALSRDDRADYVLRKVTV